MKIYVKLAAVSALALLSLNSCKSQYELLLNSADVDAKYEAAFNYFNNKIDNSMYF